MTSGPVVLVENISLMVRGLMGWRRLENKGGRVSEEV